MNLRPLVCSALVAAAALSGAAEPRSEQPLQMAAPAASLDAAFHEAVLKCFHSYRYNDSAMRELLRQGADVNAVDAFRVFALFEAQTHSFRYSACRVSDIAGLW